MIGKAYIRNSLAGVIFLSFTAYAAEAEPVEVANKKAENYHKLLLKRPGNPTVFNRFVNAWLDTGEKKGLSSWLKQRAESGKVPDLQVLSAYYAYLGEEEQALAILSKAVQKEPANASLRMARAKMLARSLAFEQALKDLDLAAKDEKLGIEAFKLKGIYLARSGQIKKAVATWKEVITRFPNDTELREDLIELLVVEGLYKDAVTSAKELITMTKDPYMKVVRQMRLADIQILAGQREEGLSTYQKVLDSTGEGTWIEREILARLEKVYLREDNIKGLRELYQSIREKYPRRISIQKALAHQMAATGEIDEAIALFKDILKITPGNMKNRQDFMNFLEKNEKWKEAKVELTDLLKSRKNDPLLWQKLAQLEQLLENKHGVKDALKHVWDLKKSTPEGVITTANLYDQAEFKKDAEALLLEGRKLFADSDEIKEALASFLIQNKKEEEAIAIWRKMAEDAPRDILLRVARSLSGHDKLSEAFALLLKRVKDFENDVMVLSKICSLVTNEEEAKAVLPHAMNLMGMATTPTDLESYMRLVVQVVNTAEQEEKVTDQLVAKTPLTVAECCLLAELFTNLGDSIGATKYLEKAEEIDQGLLAKFYRVHYNERRGELASAVSMMESILASPDGNKTVYMRRLVGLLQRDGKLVEALERVGEWKRMAPGDRAAWQKRADILSILGRSDESVTELRRMIGKFGSEESLRASLASGLLDSGDYQGAKKIYEQLYDEAESLQGKLKWVAELAQLASQEGSLAELLENFDQRGRLNPQSIEPLLAKAEIYNVLNQYKERREMLIEATRKRPDDAQLLIKLSEVEERAGELDQAITTLRQAVRSDKSFESKNRLAKLLIRSGETEAGLSILAQIPSESSDPRKVEKTIESLIKGSEPEVALKYLKKLPQHHEDWRLLYLKGFCLLQMGEDQEAYRLFASMKNARGEIKGVTPLVKPKQIAQRRFNTYPTFKGWSDLSPYLNYIRREDSTFANMRRYGRSYSRSYGATSLINLPGTAKEASWLGTLRAGVLSSRFSSEKKKNARSELSIDGVEELELFFMVYLDRQQQGYQKEFHEAISKRLEKDPENPVLLTYWLRELKPDSAPSKERALEVVATMEKYSHTAAISAIQRMQGLKVLSGDEVVTYLLDLYANVGEEKKDDLIATMINKFNHRTDLNEALQKRITELRAHALQKIYSQENEPKDIGWISSLLVQLLSSGKGDEAVKLINHLCQWEVKRKPGQKPAATLGYYGYSHSYRSRHSHYGAQFLVPPPKIPTEAKGVHSVLFRMVTNSLRQTQTSSSGTAPAVDTEQRKLWKLLRSKPAKGKPPVAAPLTNSVHQYVKMFESLKGKTDKIENPLLRALILMVLEEDDSLRVLVKQFEKSENYTELQIAAGYYHSQENTGKVYEVLQRLSGVSGLSASNRKKVDGYLVYTGSLIAGDKDSEANLEAAKRAALRLRKSVVNQEKTKLLTVMNTLGLEEEVERMAKVTKHLAPTIRRPASMRPPRGTALSLTLIREDKKEEAVRESVREIRRLLKQGSNSRSELTRYISFLKTHELVDATMEKLDPGEDASFTRRLRYADFCVVLEKSEQAYAIYTTLLKERPRSVEAVSGWMSVCPREGAVKRILRKGEDGKVDFRQLDTVFSHMHRIADNNVDVSLCMMAVIADFLKQLEPSINDDVNLSWVNYLMVSRVKDTYFQDYRLASLITKGSSGTLSAKNAEKTAERDRIARELFISMIRHPQTAEQGFILLGASSARLGTTDKELLKWANKAATQMLSRPDPSEQYSRTNMLWRRHGLTGTSSTSGPANSVGPIAYLASAGMKSGSNLLSEEILATIKEHQPVRFKRISLVSELGKVGDKKALEQFEQWKKELSENTSERDAEINKLIDTLLLIKPKGIAWTGALQTLILDDQGIGYSSSDWTNARAKWARWVMINHGSDACLEYLEKMIIARLAPKDKWPILVKLGNRRLPSEYRQKIYSVESVFNLMFTDPLVSGVATRVIIKNDFAEVFTNTSYRMRNLWSVTHSSPESFIEWLKESGLADKRAKGSSFEASRVFFISNGASQVRMKSSKMKEPAAKLLLSDKTFDPMLAQIIAARFLGASKGREVITKTIANNPKDFAALKDHSKQQTQTLIKYWFPNLTSDGSNKKTALYLKAFRQDLIEEARAKAATWLKDGITVPQNNSNGNGYVASVVQMIEDDPYQGAALWIRILQDVRKQSALLGRGNPYSGSSYMMYDQWNYNLISKISSSNSSNVSLVNRVKFLHRLYHSEMGNYLLEPSVHTNYGYYTWQKFEKFIKAQKVPQNKSYQATGLALEAVAKQLTEDEQATLVVILQQGLVDRIRINSKDRAEYQKWVTERYADQSTPLAAAMKSLALIRVRNYSSSTKDDRELQRQEERKFYMSLLKHKGLSIPMRTELVHWTSSSSTARPLLASEEAWTFLAKLMEDYQKGGRVIGRSVWQRMISYLAKIEFDGREKVAGRVASSSESLLLKSKTSSSSSRATLTKNILMLALEGGNKEIVRRYMTTQLQEFRGNLVLMLGLVKQGEIELANRLVIPDSKAYNTSGLGVYDTESHKLYQTLIDSVPENARYRLEVLLANCGDSSKTKHSVVKKDRMIALAKRYEKEKPAMRVARMEILALLSAYLEAATLVEKDLREVVAKTTYGKLILTHSRSEYRIEKEQFSKVLKRIIQIDVKAGRYAEIVKNLKSLRILEGDNSSYTAASSAAEILRLINPELMLSLGRSPEQANKMLPLAEEITRCYAALGRHSSALRYSSQSISVIIYCVAGKSDDYDALIKSMTKTQQANYEKYLNSDSLSYKVRYLVSSEWKAAENAENRHNLFMKLLGSEWFCKNISSKKIKANYLTQYGLLTYEDFYAVASGLPNTNTRKPELLCEKAGLMIRKRKTAAEVDKIYAEAYSTAQSQKNEQAESMVLAHRCVMWANKGKLDQARKWSEKVEPSLLSKVDADLFNKTKKKLGKPTDPK